MVEYYAYFGDEELLGRTHTYRERERETDILTKREREGGGEKANNCRPNGD